MKQAKKEDLHDTCPLEDTSAPVDIRDTSVEVLRVEDEVKVVSQEKDFPSRDESPQATNVPFEGVEGAGEVVPQKEDLHGQDASFQAPYTPQEGVNKEDGKVLLEHNLPVQPPSPKGCDTHQGVGNDEAASVVRRSLCMPARFRQRVVELNDSFLENLRECHSVMVFHDPAKKKMHIKGPKEGVVAYYDHVRDLLAEWRRNEATQQ